MSCFLALIIFSFTISHLVKIREDGLETGSMNVVYGGVAPEIHNTAIREFGPHLAMLYTRNKQSTIFDKVSKDIFWFDGSPRVFDALSC